MRPDYGTDVVEGAWVLEGTDGRGRPVRLLFGETELARAYLGITIGRHPALCERIVEDPGVSRRHLRVGMGESGLFVEDLNSLNGTVVDGVEMSPFRPEPLEDGQTLVLGQVRLAVTRAGDH